MKLSELKKETKAIIKSLEDLDDKSQIRLMEIGFVPGKEIKRLQSTILSGPISFEIEGHIIALSKKDADKITVD